MFLEIKNDWEVLTYYFNGIKINEKSDGIATLKNGNKVYYKSRVEKTHYMDMGNRYSVERFTLTATINYNNQKLEIPLTQLDIETIESEKKE